MLQRQQAPPCRRSVSVATSFSVRSWRHPFPEFWLGIVNTITLLVIQEIRRGPKTSSSKKAIQTRPLILTGVPISELVIDDRHAVIAVFGRKSDQDLKFRNYYVILRQWTEQFNAIRVASHGATRIFISNAPPSSDQSRHSVEPTKDAITWAQLPRYQLDEPLMR
jgi:hypothetical protein